MHYFSKQIFRLLLCLSLISVSHFLVLQFQLPRSMNLLLTACLAFVMLFIFNKSTTSVSENGRSVPLILVVVLTFFAIAFLFRTRKYGGWDAIGIYHFAANYLTHPQHWKNIWLTPRQHSDYPLFLGSLIGLLRQLISGIPTYQFGYALSLLFTLAIPCLLYIEIKATSILFAWVALAAFFANLFYLNNGINQYADIPLGGFTLLAFIALQHLKNREDSNLVWFFWTAMGAMLWTKNEGIFYATILVLLNAKSIVRFTVRKPFSFLFFLLFVLALVLLKRNAPESDLFQHLHHSDSRLNIVSMERLETILVYLTSEFFLTFPVVALMLTVYLIQCLIRRKAPAAPVLSIFCFFTGIVCIYMVTPYSLGWHLATSARRVLLQSAIPLTYVLAHDWPRT